MFETFATGESLKDGELFMDEDGYAWYQYQDERRQVRTSFMGNIGPEGQVRAWCQANGIPFRVWRPRDVARRLPVTASAR